MGNPSQPLARVHADGDMSNVLVPRPRNVIDWWEYFTGQKFDQARGVYDLFAKDRAKNICLAPGAGAAAIADAVYTTKYHEALRIPTGDEAMPLKHPLKGGSDAPPGYLAGKRGAMESLINPVKGYKPFAEGMNLGEIYGDPYYFFNKDLKTGDGAGLKGMTYTEAENIWKKSYSPKDGAVDWEAMKQLDTIFDGKKFQRMLAEHYNAAIEVQKPRVPIPGSKIPANILPEKTAVWFSEINGVQQINVDYVIELPGKGEIPMRISLLYEANPKGGITVKNPIQGPMRILTPEDILELQKLGKPYKPLEHTKIRLILEGRKKSESFQRAATPAPRPATYGLPQSEHPNGWNDPKTQVELQPSGGQDKFIYRGMRRESGTRLNEVVRMGDADATGVFTLEEAAAQNAIFDFYDAKPKLTGPPEGRAGVVRIRVPADVWDELVTTKNLSQRSYPGFADKTGQYVKDVREIRVNSDEAKKLINSLEKDVLPAEENFRTSKSPTPEFKPINGAKPTPTVAPASASVEPTPSAEPGGPRTSNVIVEKLPNPLTLMTPRQTARFVAGKGVRGGLIGAGIGVLFALPALIQGLSRGDPKAWSNFGKAVLICAAFGFAWEAGAAIALRLSTTAVVEGGAMVVGEVIVPIVGWILLVVQVGFLIWDFVQEAERDRIEKLIIFGEPGHFFIEQIQGKGTNEEFKVQPRGLQYVVGKDDEGVKGVMSERGFRLTYADGTIMETGDEVVTPSKSEAGKFDCDWIPKVILRELPPLPDNKMKYVREGDKDREEGRLAWLITQTPEYFTPPPWKSQVRYSEWFVGSKVEGNKCTNPSCPGHASPTEACLKAKRSHFGFDSLAADEYYVSYERRLTDGDLKKRWFMERFGQDQPPIIEVKMTKGAPGHPEISIDSDETFPIRMPDNMVGPLVWAMWREQYKTTWLRVKTGDGGTIYWWRDYNGKEVLRMFWAEEDEDNDAPIITPDQLKPIRVH